MSLIGVMIIGVIGVMRCVTHAWCGVVWCGVVWCSRPRPRVNNVCPCVTPRQKQSYIVSTRARIDERMQTSFGAPMSGMKRKMHACIPSSRAAPFVLALSEPQRAVTILG